MNKGEKQRKADRRKERMREINRNRDIEMRERKKEIGVQIEGEKDREEDIERK